MSRIVSDSPSNPTLATQADLYLDECHHEFLRLGDRLIEVFPPQGDRISTQVRNLQQIVTTSTRFSDIEDFVKNQMGKGRGQNHAWQQIGDEILEVLRRLRAVVARQPGGSPDQAADPELALDFRLRLARGWVRAVASQYLYRFALRQMN